MLTNSVKKDTVLRLQRPRHKALSFVFDMREIYRLDEWDWKEEFDRALINLKNPIFTFQFFKAEADRGQANAQFIVAILFQLGIGVTPSNIKAFQYLKLAVNQGLAKAQYEIVYYYLYLSQKQIALDYLQASAKQNYIPALIMLAERFYYIEEEKQDPISSVSYQSQYAKEVREDPTFAIEAYNKVIDLLKNKKIYFNLIRLKDYLQTYQRELLERFAYVNSQRAKEFFSLLDHEIFYPGSKKIDLSMYDQNQDLKTLQILLQAYVDQPAYLSRLNLSFEETNIIRDAMIANPRLTVLSSKKDGYGLQEAFHRLGYKHSNCLKRCLLNEYGAENWYGFVFSGES